MACNRFMARELDVGKNGCCRSASEYKEEVLEGCGDESSSSSEREARGCVSINAAEGILRVVIDQMTESFDERGTKSCWPLIRAKSARVQRRRVG